MLDRTENPNCAAYINYGGRGIFVCEDWHDFATFAEDMGPSFKPELTLERVDNNGPYCLENCRWIDFKGQQRNKRQNHTLDWQGSKYTVTEWAETIGLKPNTLVYRIRRGWSVERALTTPTLKHQPNNP